MFEVKPSEVVNYYSEKDLAGQIFCHRVYPSHRTNRLVDDLSDGTPLFGLKGRATLRIGALNDIGANLVFFIPWLLQTEVISLPEVSDYESYLGEWVFSVNQIPDHMHKILATHWLRNIVGKRKPFYGKRNGLPTEDVRCLSSAFLIGVATVDLSDFCPNTLTPQRINYSSLSQSPYNITSKHVVAALSSGIYEPSPKIKAQINRLK